MLTPEHFAQVALSCGTTTVCADPHEIANVLGIEGVRGLADACRSLPLRVLLTAPSTIPSAPGLEDSGFDVGPAEMEALLDIPGVAGLGEVMDFNAVAAGDERMLSVIEAAANHGVFLDGHVSALTGRRLQTFRAMGIDSDHTVPSAEKLREELALGFTVQVQECMLNREIVQAMNDAPVQDRICLVTDDVPLPRLMRQGHLNFVVERPSSWGWTPSGPSGTPPSTPPFACGCTALAASPLAWRLIYSWCRICVIPDRSWCSGPERSSGTMAAICPIPLLTKFQTTCRAPFISVP